MKNVKIKNPESKLITIYTVNDSVQAELIKNMLADHEIEAEVGGEHQAGLTGALEIQIIVKECNAKAGLEFIKIHFSNV